MRSLTTKRSIQKIIVYGLPMLILLVATQAQAQQCTGSCLNSPLNRAISGIPQFFSMILKASVMILLPIISLAIVFSGFMFVKARGNERELATAKRNFFYVIFGAILLLGAWLFANLIGNTVSQILPTT
ncbi:hypothetical protein FJY93_02355 [Candidatus Kaiserbacteria bacterium]|nr:hypothetical protein [Candidatus Kaiserbacteria bacterium]